MCISTSESTARGGHFMDRILRDKIGEVRGILQVGYRAHLSSSLVPSDVRGGRDQFV